MQFESAVDKVQVGRGDEGAFLPEDPRQLPSDVKLPLLRDVVGAGAVLIQDWELQDSHRSFQAAAVVAAGDRLGVGGLEFDLGDGVTPGNIRYSVAQKII